MIFIWLFLVHTSSHASLELGAFRRFFAVALHHSDGPSTRQVEELALTPAIIRSLSHDDRPEAQIYGAFLEYLGIGFERAPYRAAQILLKTLRRIQPGPFEQDLFQSHERKLYLAAHGCILAAALLSVRNYDDFQLLLQKFNPVSTAIRGSLGPNWIYRDLCYVMLHLLERYASRLQPTEIVLRNELFVTQGILGGPFMKQYAKIVEDDPAPPLPTLDAELSSDSRGFFDGSSESTARSNPPSKWDQEDTSTDISVSSG